MHSWVTDIHHESQFTCQEYWGTYFLKLGRNLSQLSSARAGSFASSFFIMRVCITKCSSIWNNLTYSNDKALYGRSEWHRTKKKEKTEKLFYKNTPLYGIQDVVYSPCSLLQFFWLVWDLYKNPLQLQYFPVRCRNIPRNWNESKNPREK